MFGIERKKTIKLYYYKTTNIGDILNEVLIEKIFGINVIEELHIKAEMISIGSILDCLLSNGRIGKSVLDMQSSADKWHPIHIWGTGFMYPLDEGARLIRPVKIHALRGEFTRKQISKLLGKECQCVLADPGLLASELLDEYPDKKYDVGIVPHFVDINENSINMMKNHYIKQGLEVIVIDVKDADSMKILNEIASCNVILSTSLHGLIIADSFGIPNQWCVASDKILGGSFKFQDYYSSYGIQETPFDLRKGQIPEIEWVVQKYQIKQQNVKEKKMQLLKCFPYQTKKGKKSLIKIQERET